MFPFFAVSLFTGAALYSCCMSHDVFLRSDGEGKTEGTAEPLISCTEPEHDVPERRGVYIYINIYIYRVWRLSLDGSKLAKLCIHHQGVSMATVSQIIYTNRPGGGYRLLFGL